MVAAVQPEFAGAHLRGSRYRIGMWVTLAAILMMFTALTSAYIVRAGSANDWQPLAMPRVLLLSTALILVSSWHAGDSASASKSCDRSLVTNGGC